MESSTQEDARELVIDQLAELAEEWRIGLPTPDELRVRMRELLMSYRAAALVDIVGLEQRAAISDVESTYYRGELDAVYRDCQAKLDELGAEQGAEVEALHKGYAAELDGLAARYRAQRCWWCRLRDWWRS